MAKNVSTVDHVCGRCGCIYRPTSNVQIRCSSCRVEVLKERKATWARQYFKTDRGKEKRREYEARCRRQGYKNSTRYREIMRMSVRKYRATPKGHGVALAASRRHSRTQAGRATMARYQSSEKGKIALAKVQARRRADDPEAFADGFSRLMLRRRTSCASCSAAPVKKPAHQVDHVIPLAIIRMLALDLPSDRNLQVLCYDCHRAKTSQDMRDIWRLRRALCPAM